jgi:hypothetical protein
MSGFLRQGTSATIRFGAMQSTTDGSAATGATLTVKLSRQRRTGGSNTTMAGGNGDRLDVW